jgi:hypothetical protein
MGSPVRINVRGPVNAWPKDSEVVTLNDHAVERHG